MSSTDQAFVDECRHLKSMFNHLGYPGSLMNGIIDKCDYPSTLDAKTKSDETLESVFRSKIKSQRTRSKGKCAIPVQKSALMYNQSSPARNLSRI